MNNELTTDELGKILSLPHREQRPRVNGLNVIFDPGLPTGMLEILLANNQHIDAMEMGPGAVFVTNDLNERIRICEKNKITPFLGGLVLETFLVRGKIDSYLQLCKDYAIRTFQVSDSCISIPHKQKCEIIEKLSTHGNVYSRVGSRDPAHIIPPYKWIELMKAEMKSGAKYVFASGGETGQTGLYRSSGEAREGLIDEILTQVPAERLIWDAPHHKQRVYFIELLGANCNLSLLTPKHILQIEATRLGLHSDTFGLYLKEK